jgi:uncharacterized protein YndB with AHSA1/START domain
MPASSERTSASPNAMEREIVITRVFDAPRDLVFKAWTEPEHLKQWWGPEQWTNPFCLVDLRPGGEWSVVMRSPDGFDHLCGGVYREIVAPERLVFTNNASDQSGKALLEGLTTVVLAEENGKTRLTLRTRAVGLVSYADRMLAGMEAGWTQSLDRLERFTVRDREIVTTRIFDAPRDVVFQAWTEPAHLAQWWGPNGFTSTIHEMDVRPGGAWRMIMHGPDGVDYKNDSVFLEVVKPERLVYLHSSPKFQATVTFDEVGGKTHLTLRTVFDTAEEMNRVVKEFGAVEGAKQTLGRLAEFLEK